VKAKSYFNSGVHVVENNFQQPLSGSLSPNSMEVMRMSLAGKAGAAAAQLNGSYIGEEVKYSTLDWPAAASRRFSAAERGRYFYYMLDERIHCKKKVSDIPA
jgi:hypothetical protein